MKNYLYNCLYSVRFQAIILILIPVIACSQVYEEYIIQFPESLNHTLYKADQKTYTDILYRQLTIDDEEGSVNNIDAINFVLSDWYLVRFKSSFNSNLSELQSIGKIKYYQKNHKLGVHAVPPNDPYYAEQWYHHKIKAVQAWSAFSPNDDIILAIIDTGVDYFHPDLQGSLWINIEEDLNGNGILDNDDLNGIDDDKNGFIDDVIGWDFTDAPRFPDGGDYIDPDNDPMDEFSNGHGTQIAGIIAAQTNNGIGISGLLPGIKVMNIRAGTASGYLEEDDVARSVLYAIENGARIINMSFGDVVVSRFLRDVIHYAYSQGVVIIASAGNSGTDELNYPAGFVETISVGATNRDDEITGFSNWGQTIDLTAPGEEIYAPGIGNIYNIVNGTSFSAPIVAAGAGLILSLHPDFSVEQVRNVLKSTSDDLGISGWDEIYGSGRVNMESLSKVTHGSSLFIHNPISGSTTFADSVTLIVTINNPDLKTASMQYGIGASPRQWITIVPDISFQIIEDTIATFDISSITDTTVIFRLQAKTWEGNVSEYRSILYIDKTSPLITNVRHKELLDGSGYSMLVEFETDDITTGEVYFRPENSQVEFLKKTLNYETQNHKVIINSDQISGNVEYYVKVENLSGLQQTDNNNGNYYNFDLSPDIITGSNFYQVDWTFPSGYLLSTATDLDNDGNYEIVISKYDIENSFGAIQIYEFSGNQFDLQFETSFRAIPRSYGDADSDGKKELLLGYGRNSYLLEANQENEFPSTVVWSDTNNFWASQISDLDNDGVNEIIGRIGNEYKIFESSGDNLFIDKYTFSNPTQGMNEYGTPRTIIDDLDNDGHLEFIFGDYDGDIIIYENTGDDNFIFRYAQRLPFPDATDYFVSGKLFNGAYKSLIAGSHTPIGENYEHEFEALYWNFNLINSTGNNTYQKTQEININNYSSVKDFDSGFNTGLLESGGNEYLFLATYPNLYIFKEENNSITPIWHYTPIRTNTILVHDFNKNGNPEFYFNDGDKFIGFESTLINRPVPPSRFRAHPLDTLAIRLDWSQAPGADRYIIYKGNYLTDLAKYDSTVQDLFYIDSLVVLDSLYLYAIQTVDFGYDNPVSLLSNIQNAKANYPPRIDSIVVSNDRQCKVFFNETMDQNTLIVENIKLQTLNIYASSVIPFYNNSASVVSFPSSFPDNEMVGLEFKNIKDKDNTLLDVRDSLKNIIYIPLKDKPYIADWQFDSRYSLNIKFNIPMDTVSMLEPINYAIDPVGFVEHVDVMDLDNKEYRLHLSMNTYNSAVGITTYLTCNNLRSREGQIFSEGNRIALVITPNDLDDIFVFPQPAPVNSENIVFAKVPPLTEILIFDVNGRKICRLQEMDQNGGVIWNLRNKDGHKVAAGVYLFYAKWNNQTKFGKFTIVR